MNTVLDKIQKISIVPAVVLDDAQNAIPLANSLFKGGIPCAVIGFNTEAAEEAVRMISEKFPQMTIGSGEVLNAEDARRAVDAGADFIACPDFDLDLIQYCIDRNVPVIPRVSGSDDIEAAHSLGLEAVSFLSDSLSDSTITLQRMSGLYPGMKFMPEFTSDFVSGSLSEDALSAKTAGLYPEPDNILACTVKGITKQKWIQEGAFNRIECLAKETVRALMRFEVSHIGINCGSDEKAEETAGIFEKMFGFTKKSGPTSVYAGAFLECMKPPHFGTNGHIAITANSIVRAKAYFETIGYEFNENSAKFDNGRMIVIYFKEEIGGFAVHIVQK